MTNRLRSYRLPRWLLWVMALTCATSAALSYMFRMANGIVVGALIGLPGRERQIALAQHRGIVWLGASVVFEVGAAVAVFSLLEIGSDFGTLPRYVVRGMTAALSSLAITLLLGTLIFQVLR